MKITLCLKCGNFWILFVLVMLLIPMGGCSPKPEQLQQKVMLREVRRIPAEADEQGFYFAGIYNACQNSRYLYVADWKDHSIKIFNKDFEFVKQFGKKGAGPCEFSIIFSGMKCDENCIYIMTINRLYLFSTDGGFIEEINLPFIPTDVFPLEDGYLFTQHDKQVLRLTDRKGKSKEVFYPGEKFEISIGEKFKSYYHAPPCFLLSQDRILVTSLRSYKFSIFNFRTKVVEKSVERDVDFNAFHYTVGKHLAMGIESRGGYGRIIPYGDRYFYFYTGTDEKLRFDIYGPDFKLGKACVTDQKVFPFLVLSENQFLGYDPQEPDSLQILGLYVSQKKGDT